jgi:hypothetical protein
MYYFNLIGTKQPLLNFGRIYCSLIYYFIRRAKVLTVSYFGSGRLLMSDQFDVALPAPRVWVAGFAA